MFLLVYTDSTNKKKVWVCNNRTECFSLMEVHYGFLSNEKVVSVSRGKAVSIPRKLPKVENILRELEDNDMVEIEELNSEYKILPVDPLRGNIV